MPCMDCPPPSWSSLEVSTASMPSLTTAFASLDTSPALRRLQQRMHSLGRGIHVLSLAILLDHVGQACDPARCKDVGHDSGLRSP